MLGRKKSEEESEKWFPGKFLGVKQKKKDASEESSSDQNAGTEKQVEEDNEDTESGRKCFGCRYGETPGERVQILLKDAYYTVRENRAKLAKNPVPFGQAKLYKLERGSMYGTGMIFCDEVMITSSLIVVQENVKQWSGKMVE